MHMLSFSTSKGEHLHVTCARGGGVYPRSCIPLSKCAVAPLYTGDPIIALKHEKNQIFMISPLI